MKKYRVLEDLKSTANGRVIIPKGSIVKNCDDFPWYGIMCPKLREEAYNKDGDFADSDDYSMTVHMSDIKSEEDLPWYGKLEEIIDEI